MRRVSLFISMLFCLTTGYAQKECDGGNKDLNPNPPHHQDPLDDTSTSGGISADPNEIIGPMGYDSIHWVSVKDVLNYTILFENTPDLLRQINRIHNIIQLKRSL